MSMIFQDPMTGLNPVLRVGPQVDEALRLHRGMGKLAARDRTLEIFSEVGISDPEKRYLAYPYQLSGGLRQRAMIAMAMICEPKLLIADEPTTALDVTIEAQILRLMHKLCREKGTSILLITHNMGVVASVCDFVYVMYAGQVMEEAETETLFFRTAHPYTKGLLQSIPRMDEKQSRLFTIEGAVPDLRQLPAGCVFSNRCPEAREKCKKEKPPLCSLAGREGHRSRCFFSEMDP